MKLSSSLVGRRHHCLLPSVGSSRRRTCRDERAKHHECDGQDASFDVYPGNLGFGGLAAPGEPNWLVPLSGLTPVAQDR